MRKIVIILLSVSIMAMGSVGCITTRQAALIGGLAGGGTGYSMNGWKGAGIGGALGVAGGGIIGKILEERQKQEWNSISPDVRGRILGEQEARRKADRDIERYYRQKSFKETYDAKLKSYGVK